MSGDQHASAPTPAGGTADERWAHGALPARADIRRATAVLSAVAGFSDAIGFLVLFGLFTAHMSGNTTHLGVSIGLGDWGDAVTRFFPIPMFVLGIAAGAAVMEVLARRHFERAISLVLSIELALLVVFMVGGEALADERVLRQHSTGFFVLAGVATLAMGLQTAVLRKVGGLTVHTTFISGMLTQLATSAVAWSFARVERRRADPGVSPTDGEPDLAAAHARFTGAIWLCFVAGGAAGALLHEVWGFWALAVPLAVLGGVVAYDLRAGLLDPRP